MLPSTWFMSIVTLLVVDVRIRALQQKDGLVRRCHHCAGNDTACITSTISTAECSGERPLCATAAVSPNFTSKLTCGAVQKTPCSLTYALDAYTLICTCDDDLCNAPFFKDIQKQLIDFTSSNFTKNNSSDYTDDFFKLYYANVTEDNIFKTVTVEVASESDKAAPNVSHPTTVSDVANTRITLPHPTEEILPRAEAFKHEPTALSEDDEDASEGSGSYEESRSQRQPASDPADPSSFLPANENKAPPLAATFAATIPVLMYFVA